MTLEFAWPSAARPRRACQPRCQCPRGALCPPGEFRIRVGECHSASACQWAARPRLRGCRSLAAISVARSSWRAPRRRVQDLKATQVGLPATASPRRVGHGYNRPACHHQCMLQGSRSNSAFHLRRPAVRRGHRQPCHWHPVFDSDSAGAPRDPDLVREIGPFLRRSLKQPFAAVPKPRPRGLVQRFCSEAPVAPARAQMVPPAKVVLLHLRRLQLHHRLHIGHLSIANRGTGRR